MRRAAGEHVRLFNGREGEWLCDIAALDKKGGQAVPAACLRAQPAPGCAVHLVFAPLKKARMDMLVEKAVELGASHLHPVLTRRTAVREVNEARLRAQIAEAAEQCERMDVPVLSPLIPLERLCASWAGPRLLACVERSDAPPPGALLGKGADAAFLVGPEGGFDEEERAFLADASAVSPISLGATVYRAETAALVCLAWWGQFLLT